ncbi:MAG: MFS transporter [Blastocatellales bacterium]
MKFQNDFVSPALLVVWAEGFLSRLSFGIISFALPIFAYKRLGLSLTQTGFLFSLNLISEQLFKPLMGWVADHAGLKRSFTVAIALRSLVALLLAFAVSPWQVYSIRFLHGVAESLRDPSVGVLIAENARRNRVASAYAWYSTAKMSAGSVGGALGGVLLALTSENYSIVFAVAFALSLLPLFAVARYLSEPERGIMTSEEAASDTEPKIEVERTALLPVVVLGFLIACTARMITQLFPVLAMEYGGLSVGQTGLIYAVSLVVVIAAGPAFGWLSDNVSRKLVLMMRGVANTVSSLMFWFFPTFAGLAAGNVMDSMGKAAFRPAWGALMAQFAGSDRRRRARTMSYLSLGEGLGETVGPLLGGFLWSVWGVGVMLGARVALALIGEIYAVMVVGDARRAASAPQPPEEREPHFNRHVELSPRQAARPGSLPDIEEN